MVAVYTSLIVKGARTFESVPTKLQPEVRQMLLDLGLDTNGQPLA